MNDLTQETPDFNLKLLSLGETGVGKTSIINMYSENIFFGNQLPTIGIDFKTKNLKYKSKDFKILLWDTAGQERFRNITASYYKGGHGVLVVYDITDRESFENLNSWLIEVEKNANKNIFKLLVGNKCDLESDRKVSFQEGKEFAEGNGMKFIETSAKDDLKVYDAFELIASEIIKSNINKEVNEKKNNISLGHGDDISQKKKF